MKKRIVALLTFVILVSVVTSNAFGISIRYPDDDSISVGVLTSVRLEQSIENFDTAIPYKDIPNWNGEVKPDTPASLNLGSGCVGSACLGSICFGSGCIGSACFGSACASSGCSGSACGGSVCAGSACGSSVCAGSVCGGSVCAGSVCGGSVCSGSACSASPCYTPNGSGR